MEFECLAHQDTSDADYGLPQPFYSTIRRLNKLDFVLAQTSLIEKVIENILDEKLSNSNVLAQSATGALKSKLIIK